MFSLLAQGQPSQGTTLGQIHTEARSAGQGIMFRDYGTMQMTCCDHQSEFYILEERLYNRCIAIAKGYHNTTNKTNHTETNQCAKTTASSAAYDPAGPLHSSQV